MSSRNAARIAWSVCGLTLVLIVCAVALAVLNDFDLGMLAFLVAEATAALVGGLIASRRPRNPVGWLIAGHALCFSLGEFSRQYAIYGLLTDPGSLPLARVMASPPYWVWYPGLMLVVAFLPLYFPNGRLLSPRWRPVVWLAASFAVIAASIAAVQPGGGETRDIPNPLGIEGLNEMLRQFSIAFDIGIPASWLVLGAASAASLVVRFLRSRGEERQQIKWFTYAMVLLISFSLVDQIFRQVLPPVVNTMLFTAVFASPWIAIAVAVLRYRLYDIDIIINRTLVYGSLTGTLALVYFGGVALLQGLFRALTGQGSQLAVVASTLVIAALFVPLRRRIQEFIDRRFYRRKYNAAKTLEAFSSKLRDETDLDRLGDEMVSVVRETMQPEHVSLWLRVPERER